VGWTYPALLPDISIEIGCPIDPVFFCCVRIFEGMISPLLVGVFITFLQAFVFGFELGTNTSSYKIILSGSRSLPPPSSGRLLSPSDAHCSTSYLWLEEELHHPANLGGLCHHVITVVPTGQPPSHRRDERHAEPSRHCRAHGLSHTRRRWACCNPARAPRTPEGCRTTCRRPEEDAPEFSLSKHIPPNADKNPLVPGCCCYRTLARALAKSGAMAMASAHLRSSMCRTSSPILFHRDHSSSSV
jgi:hypothetical protein